MYTSVICPVKCVREREHNGEDAITTQNLFKLEDGLQFEIMKTRTGDSITYICQFLPQKTTVRATLSTKHMLEYSLMSDFIREKK